jgi:hypothetical protein
MLSPAVRFREEESMAEEQDEARWWVYLDRRRIWVEVYDDGEPLSSMEARALARELNKLAAESEARGKRYSAGQKKAWRTRRHA